MKKQLIIFATLICIALSGFSQQLPLGTCGIVNVYDAAGNRTKRVYFCNNGEEPYPENNIGGKVSNEAIIVGKGETSEFQTVDALFPNPTTGKFFITFSKTLVNASVSISDNNGKVISTFRASGTKVEFDLSPYAAGVYYVRIEENGKAITKKVVKQ